MDVAPGTGVSLISGGEIVGVSEGDIAVWLAVSLAGSAVLAVSEGVWLLVDWTWASGPRPLIRPSRKNPTTTTVMITNKTISTRRICLVIGSPVGSDGEVSLAFFMKVGYGGWIFILPNGVILAWSQERVN